MTPAPWQIWLSWVFVALSLACAVCAVWFLTKPNPSGDYLSGMASLFIAMIAGGGTVLSGVCAVVARLIHRRRGQWLAAGVVALVLAACGALFLGVI